MKRRRTDRNDVSDHTTTSHVIFI